jgi:hypothetical protein
MKVSSTAARTPARRAGVALATRGGVQRKAQGGSAIASAHERQADSRGQAFVRGEHGLSRGLLPASAAGMVVAGSRGEGLPTPLRASLEQAFHADLGALRIHRDAAAHTAAARLHAEAFASGADIYFAQGAFDPGSVRGQSLIAHETTHVLQQTGRASFQGRLQVRPLGGTGQVQCSPRELPRAFSTTQSLTRLANVHARAAAPDMTTQIRALEQAVRDQISGDDLWGDHPFRQALLDRVDAGEWSTAPSPVLALLADVMRALRADLQLADLLQTDPAMPCVLHDHSVRTTTLDAYGPAWLQDQLVREPLAQWYPRAFVHSFRSYLFAPRRDIPALWANDTALGDLATWSSRHVEEAAASPDSLVENELYFDALDLLRTANEERIELLRIMQRRANESAPGATPFLIRLSVAQQLVEFFTRLSTQAPSANASDTTAVFAPLLPELILVAQRAQALWSSVRGVLIEQQGLALLGSQGDSPLAQAFHHALTAFASTVFARDATGRLPSPTVYNNALVAARRALNRFVANNVETDLIRASARADFDPAQATWSGLVLTFIPTLLAEIDRYDVVADRRNEARLRPDIAPVVSDRQWGADLRIEHRLVLCHALLPLANVMQWSDLQSTCQSVGTATDTDAGFSELALLGDWREHTGVQIADFAAGEAGLGFEPDTPIRGFGFLTPRMLAHVFYSEYASLVGGAIEDILVGNATRAAEEGDFSVNRPTIRSRVDGVMAAAPRPRRHQIPAGQWRLALNPGDELAAYSLVMLHPKTQHYMRQQGVEIGLSPTAALAIFPVRSPMRDSDLFFWSLPPLEPVVTRLRAIPELDQAVQEALARPADEAAMSIDPSLEDATSAPAPVVAPTEEDAMSTPAEGPYWWRWMQAFLAMDPASVAQHSQTFADSAMTESNAASVRLNALWRRAWIQDRQLLVRFQLLPLMQAYRPYGVETYNHPGQTLQHIVDFSEAVLPAGDADHHESLALLELFRPPAAGETDIAEALSGSRRFDVIITWQNALRRAVRAAAMPQRVLLLDLMTPGERADLGWLDTSSARMQTVIDAMEAQKAQAQLMTGFMVRAQGEEDAAHPAFVALPGTRELSGAEPFTINGVIYQLLGSSHTVEFHPDYGSLEQPDSYSPSVLVVDGVSVDPDPATQRRTGSRELFRISRNGRLTIVRERDDELLEEISNAVGMQAVVASLAELESFLEWAANLTLDVLEFVPGAGQVLMATRLATSVLGFIMSPEFEEIKHQVLENPTGFIDQLIEFVSGEVFEPDRLIGWAFLGGLAPSMAPARNPRPAPRPRGGRASGGTLSRFAAVVQRLARVGVNFGRSVNRVRQRAGQSFLSLESFVQGHPMLALGFDFIGEFADLIDPDILREAMQLLARAGVVMSEIQSAFLHFPEHLGELIHTLNSLEIPREILPMDEVLEILIRLVIDRLGAKYRIAGNAILFVLDQLGLKQQLFDAIADQLPDSANPNHYWSMFVDETLQPRFDAVRSDLIAGLNQLLDQFGFPQVASDTAADAAITPHGSEFPESEASPARDPLPAPAARLPSEPRGGQPLNPLLRRRMEGEFGHDFAHVRLHGGESARPVTQGFGADGLTTGSHVYLAPSLAPDSGAGQRVLRHELAHVLQQAGPRPLGAGLRHGATPQVPSRRGGLRVDPDSERAADAMAASASAGRGPAAVPVQGARSGLWQPALSAGTVGRIVRRLARGQALMEHYRHLDPEHGGTVPGIETLPPGVSPPVANLHTELRDGMRSMDNWPRGYTAELQAQITSYYFGGNRVAELQAAVNRIARESLVEHRPRAAAGATAQGPAELRLNVRVFERGIEAYFMERGLGMRIAFHTEARDGWSYLRNSNPLRSMSFAFLNMAQVGSGSELWAELMKNTWGTACTRGSDLWNRYQGRARVYLIARGAAVGLYGSPGLVLHHNSKTEIQDLAAGSTDINLAHLPGIDDYVNATGAGARDQGSGVLSLITGLYGDPHQTGASHGKERESHHTTQFLLIEYFSNWHTLKPFKHDLALYAPVGLSVSGGQPETFTPAAGSPIGIKSLAGTSMSARGRAMPVISLSAMTHRRGKVHIQGARPDTVGDDSAATQSMAVHLKFRSFVRPAPVHDALLGDEAGFRAFTATAGGRTQMRSGIYSAMKSTYAWMRDDMATRLEDGLKQVEVPYYNALSEQAGRSERMTPTQIGPAATAAATKNRDVMETGNHWS